MLQTHLPAVSKDAPRKRHERYYFKDGNIVFLVEDTLYNVHRYFLQRDSSIFRDLFSLPPNHSEEGNSDEHPIVLEGTKSLDMERFLSTLYPRRVGKFEPQTTEECVSVLELAHKWQFDAICELVAEHLPAVAPLAEQIVLARHYGLTNVLLSARIKICEREEPLSLEEGRKLGVDECIVIGEVRQKARCNQYATTAMKFDEWDIRMLKMSFAVLDGQ